ncbi:MAG: hypothetical protein FWG31_08445 [Oscillospiraceae bacterium]|nr:hypothetical protein [Oscillospiraceae bacterium]
MKTHRIPLESLIQTGKGSMKPDSGELLIASKRVLDKNGMRCYLPGRYTLPLRFDITLKANSSDFAMQIGKGGVHFSAPINHSGGGIRRTDIATGKEEPSKHEYGCDVPLGEYTGISAVYGNEITWVEINGRVCYATRAAPYQKLPEAFTGGFSLAIGCGRDVELTVRSITVTEYENLDTPAEIAGLPEFSAFEWYLKSLPPDCRDEVVKMDDYLLKDLKNGLKCKRSADKYGNVGYVSPCGFQFKMRKYGTGGQENEHDAGQIETSWNQDPEKPDRTSEMFSALAEESPEFAGRMFSKTKGCNNAKCKANSVITYKGESKRTCGSAIKFTWLPSEFEDIRKVAAAAEEIITKEKKAKT